mgnify:CR=1 FL=1
MLSGDRLADRNIVKVYEEAWKIDRVETDDDRTYAVARAHEMLNGFRDLVTLSRLCTVAVIINSGNE